MFDILVIGSINADLVFTSDIRPKAGQTVLGKDFKIVPGGKGSNQAIAAARLGSKVGFVGCVGNDANGEMLLENFEKNKVNTNYIRKIDNVPSGVANIILAEGDNSIIVIPGANHSITKEMIDEYKEVILNSKLVLLQLEIPINIVEYIIELCYENKITTILNPAPWAKLHETVIDKISYLTPNEHECAEMFPDKEIGQAIQEYPNKLIVTQGHKGVIYHNRKEIIHIPSFKVEVVDTTGAGDTFNGAFASAIVKGLELNDAIQFANKAAAISVTKFGAQSGMPYKSEII